MTYIIKTKNINPVIFIHIPKNAGNSILSMASQNYTCFHVPNNRTENNNFHSTLKDVEIYMQNDKKVEIFTIVRNPFERACSWFLFRQEVLRIGLKALYAGKKTNKVVNARELVYEEYLDMLDRGFYYWLKKYYNKKWDFTWFSLANNQNDWIRGNNYKKVKILKLEKLDKEISKIEIFKDSILPHKNKNVQRKTKKNFKNIQLLDTHSITFLEKLYAEDIDNFQYSKKDLLP